MLLLKLCYSVGKVSYEGNSDVQNNLAAFNSRVVFLFLGLLLVLPLHAQAKSSKINDLRIIVDISGSMKKTDPKNLRRSAVRLLAGLIPEGSRAGIWNFGKEVNMSVKIGAVNDEWRELAREQSKNISSAGLYTNIESVMRKASFDWKEADPRYERNIIILTDGHVDISKDDKLNKASRRRILKEVLPLFEKAKVRIHTIALSDDVDEVLLSTLSSYTDGLFKKVNSADDLQKLFLQMLEQSIKLDTLPIKDNKFNVDASINDMTLLVFNKDKSRQTMIVTPTNKSWQKSSHPDKVRWFSDDGYDLITIKKPQKGEWKIKAPTDPNNRVVVATNLKLKLNNVPSYLMLGNSLNISVQLEEDGNPLMDQRLLSKFNFVLERDAERSSERRYPLLKSDNDKFSYSVKLNAKFKEGNNEFVISAKSPTAERELRHQFKVYTTPANIKISENNGKYLLEVIPHMNIMRPKTVKVILELNDESKHTLTQHGDKWTADVDGKFKNSTFKLNINAIGADGKPIEMSFTKVLSVEGGIKKLDLASKFEEQKKHEVKREPKHDATPTEQDKHNSTPKEKDKHSSEKKNDSLTKELSDHKKVDEEENNTTFIVSAIVISNVFLAIILGGGYFFMKRRKEKLSQDLNGELDEVEIKKEEVEKEEVKMSKT